MPVRRALPCGAPRGDGERSDVARRGSSPAGSRTLSSREPQCSTLLRAREAASAGSQRSPAIDPAGRGIGDGRKADRIHRRGGRPDPRLGSSPSVLRASLERAIDYFERTSPQSVPHLRLLLARSQVALGRDDAAEAQLESGIREMESMRVSQADGIHRSLSSSVARQLFDDMVALQLDKRHDPQRALSFVERGRARQLADALQPPTCGQPSIRSLARGVGLEPDEVQRELPHGLCSRLLHGALGSPRLLGRHAGGLPILRSALARTRSGASPRPTRQRWRRGPRSRSCVSRRQGCSTSCCARCRQRSARTRPSVRSRTECCNPFRSRACGTDRRDATWSKTISWPWPRAERFSFVPLAAAAATRLARRDCSRSEIPGWVASKPRASRACAEPRRRPRRSRCSMRPSEVLTGRRHEAPHFWQGLRSAEVVHFAGHATSGGAAGGSRLLLAPDPETKIAARSTHSRSSTRPCRRHALVVLAACGTAAGEARASRDSEHGAAVPGRWRASSRRQPLGRGRRDKPAFLRGVPPEPAGCGGSCVRRCVRRSSASCARATSRSAIQSSWAGFVSLGGVSLEASSPRPDRARQPVTRRPRCFPIP